MSCQIAIFHDGLLPFLSKWGGTYGARDTGIMEDAPKERRGRHMAKFGGTYGARRAVLALEPRMKAMGKRTGLAGAGLAAPAMPSLGEKTQEAAVRV